MIARPELGRRGGCTLPFGLLLAALLGLGVFCGILVADIMMLLPYVR